MHSIYEETIRVPLVISNPILFAGDRPQNTMSLASLVDVLPTIADITNVSTPPSGLRGVSLVLRCRKVFYLLSMIPKRG